MRKVREGDNESKASRARRKGRGDSLKGKGEEVQKRVKQERMYIPDSVIAQLETNSHLTAEERGVIIHIMCETYGYWQGPHSADPVPWAYIDEFEEAKEMGLRHPVMVLRVLRRLSSTSVLERNEEGAYRINERTEEWEGHRLDSLKLEN